MRHILSIITTFYIFLINTSNSYAGITGNTGVSNGTAIDVTPVPPGGPNSNPENLGNVINNAIQIVFIVATLFVLFFIMMGAFNWITSGGDKEKIASARKMIVNALIGLAILALSFLILNVVASVLNIRVGGPLPQL